MYFGDHNSRYFQTIDQENTAECHIATLNVICGQLPAKTHTLVLEWASLHSEELMEDWRLVCIPIHLDPDSDSY